MVVDLKPASGRSNIIEVWLDGERSSTLPRALARRFGWAVPCRISEEEWERINQELPGFARQRALDNLALRDFGRVELIRKLQAAGIPEAVARQTVQKAVNNGLVNDESLAQKRAAAAARAGKSKRVILMTLQAKGIDAETAAQAAEQQDELQAAEKICHKLAAKYTDRQKLFAAMMRRGFSSKTVHDVIGMAETAREEPCMDETAGPWAEQEMRKKAVLAYQKLVRKYSDTQKHQLFAAMARRGFSIQIIQELIKGMDQEDC